MVNIPWDSLSDEAILGVIDDYVLREGTDYGAQEVTLANKRQRVLNQLKSGVAQIVYDPDGQSLDISLIKS